MMTRNKRIVSLLGLDKNIAGMFASYCHLLKAQLQEHWIINRVNNHSEVVVVSDDYSGKIGDKVKVRIILGNRNQGLEKNKESGSFKTFKISYPISSSKILTVLNQVSQVKELKKSQKLLKKEMFSLKNLFSKFMHSDTESERTIIASKQKKIQNRKQKTNGLAHKLLKLRNPNIDKTIKVVFLGRPGSGKTTAISSASSEKTLLTSEVKATDTVGLLKEQTTIGIDYGECGLKDGVQLRLYGTPGQIRYDYVQTQTVENADIYIILVDLSSVAPYSEFLYYKNIIEEAGNPDALRVVAFTHYDQKEHNMAQLSKEIRYKCRGEVLTVKIDSRNRDEVRFMLSKAAKMHLGGTPNEQHYADNGLFLKNINA